MGGREGGAVVRLRWEVIGLGNGKLERGGDDEVGL